MSSQFNKMLQEYPDTAEGTRITLFTMQIRDVGEHGIYTEPTLQKAQTVVRIPVQLHQWYIPWQGVPDTITEIQPDLPGTGNTLQPVVLVH